MELSKWSFVSKLSPAVDKPCCSLSPVSSLSFQYLPHTGPAHVGFWCTCAVLMPPSCVRVAMSFISFLPFPSQASEEASLRALESLMTEFFHNCTTNERKREIGESCPSRAAPGAAPAQQRGLGCPPQLCLHSAGIFLLLRWDRCP